MRSLNFQLLPPETRVALAAIAQGAKHPRALLHRPPRDLEVWMAAIGALAFVSLLALEAMFRDLDPTLARGLSVTARTLLAFAAIGAVLRAVRALPYVEGRYVTAAGAFELRGSSVTLFDPADFGQPTVKTTTIHTRGTYSGTDTRTELLLPLGAATWTWIWHGHGAEAREALRAMQQGRVELQQAVARGDMAAATAIDPFFPCRVTGVWQSPQAAVGPLAKVSITPALRAAQVLGALAFSLGGTALRDLNARRVSAANDAETRGYPAENVQQLRAGAAAFRARHPTLPMSALIDAMVAAAPYPVLRITLTKPDFSATSLCRDPEACSYPRAYQSSLDNDLARDRALYRFTAAMDEAFQRALPGTRAPNPIATAFYGSDNPSTLVVRAEALRTERPSYEGPPIRFTFSGALVAGAARIPIEYTWSEAVPAQGAHAEYNAQLERAVTALAREVIPPMFGEAPPRAPSATAAAPAPAQVAAGPGGAASTNPLAALPYESLGTRSCDRGTFTLRGGVAENLLRAALEVTGRCDVTLEDMTLRGAYDYGVVRVGARGRLTLRRVTIENLRPAPALVLSESARVSLESGSIITQPNGEVLSADDRAVFRAEGSRVSGTVRLRGRARIDDGGGNTGLP